MNRQSLFIVFCYLLVLSSQANPLPQWGIDASEQLKFLGRSSYYCGNKWYVPCQCRPTLTCFLKATTAKDKEERQSTVSGTIIFASEYKDYKCGAHVTGTISGLGDSTPHGWHIHEFGDVSASDGAAAGGHYNPRNVNHGIPPSATRHVGDLGNLKPDNDGNANVDFFIDIDTSEVLGRGLIVHAATDDGGQPTGNSGARLAQCVLGIKGSS